MSALFDKMTIAYLRPSTRIPASWRLSRGVERPAASPSVESTFSANPSLGLFARYCGACHRSSARLPPGFLVGDPGQVDENLRSCAERIGFRLAMWQLEAESRSKTPMPPPTFLSAASIDIDQWSESEDYHALLDYIDSLRVTPSNAQSSMNYVELPPCLPG